MSSGKQVSFQYGEVSPSLKYKSDEVSYAQGLSKLKNMYIRSTGGASNRAGLSYVMPAVSQSNIPTPGGDPGIRGFTYWAQRDNLWRTIEYSNFGGGDGDGYGFSINSAGAIYPGGGGSSGSDFSPAPSQVRFTVVRDAVFVTPGLKSAFDPITGATENVNVAITKGMSNVNNPIDAFYGESSESEFIGAVTPSYGLEGSPTFYPGSYVLTATLISGEEVYFREFKNTGYTPATWNGNTPAAGSIIFPVLGSNQIMRISMSFTPSGLGLRGKDIKNFNLYQSPGPYGLGRSFYRLTAKLLYDGVGTSITFELRGVEDAATTPPLDGGSLFAGKMVGGGEAAAYFQQRLVVALKPGITPSVKAGDIIASKLGAPRHFKQPAIYSNTGAFQFNIPVTDGTPCVALLAMERLIAFTERGVYVIRGGPEGAFSPTEINPLRISDEGCSTIVEPKMTGRRGYFVNNDHTKLMGIVFGVDGNLEVFEASIFSDHMLAEDIIQLEVINGKGDTVFLVRRDGKMVQINCTQDGTHGFGTVETGGYIEGVFRGKTRKHYLPNSISDTLNEKYYDCLYVYVIRNGIRNLEKLELRDDTCREGEMFADCARFFGTRLSLKGAQGYRNVVENSPMTTYQGNMANIQTPVSGIWTAGEPIKILTKYPIGFQPQDFVIHFFYDEEGETKFLRWIPTSNLNAPVFVATGEFDEFGFEMVDNEYTGYFTSDVPAELRDVKAQTITALEKAKRLTRWAFAFNFIENNGILLAPWQACSADPSVDGSAEVTVFADGEIVSSPLNPNKGTPLTIVRTAGNLRLDLPDYYSYGYVGQPIEAEFETLDLEASDSRTLTDSHKLINAVGVGFYKTRGGFFGMPNVRIEDMEELVSREEENINFQTSNLEGYLTINVPAEYNKTGRVNIKQVDPAPMTILAVYPKGISGD